MAPQRKPVSKKAAKKAKPSAEKGKFPEGSEKQTAKKGFQNKASKEIRKHSAKQTLLDGETLKRVFLEEANWGVAQLDSDGKIIFFNDTGAKIVDYLPSDLLGKNIESLMDKNAISLFGSICQKMSKTKNHIAHVDIPLIGKDGRLKSVDLSVHPLWAGAKQLAGYILLFRDVTDFKKAQWEWRQSETRLQSLLDIWQFTSYDLRDLFDKALDHAIRLTASKLGYIFYYDEKTRQLTLNSWSKEAMRECLITEPQTVYDLDKTGVWGEAVRQRKPIVLNDYTKPDPLKKGYPEGHVRLKRFLTIPVFDGDKIVAVIGVANKEDAYNESDIRQLTLLMEAVWVISDHRRMQAELLKKEESYRTILDVLDVGFCEMDLKGNITFINQAGARIIGYTPEGMIGTNFRTYVTAAAQEDLLALFKQIYKTREPVKRFAMEYINKDGVRRYLEISGAILIGPDGKPSGFRGLAQDITQSKWTEEALLQSEAKYFSIVENIGQTYFETDLRGYLTFFNDRLCQDLGYSRSELLKMSHRELQDPENARKTHQAFKRVYQTGEVNPSCLYEVKRKDGSIAFFDLSISLMRDAEGHPIGFRGLSRDITERKKMEDALKASEERARALIAAIPDPYFEADIHRRILYANQAFQSLFGYSLPELNRMEETAYLDETAAETMRTVFDTVLTTEMTMKNIEIEILNRAGEKRSVNLSVSLVRDADGRPVGFQGIMRDITEKKEAEKLIVESSAKLLEYSESLERNVQERTAELEKAKVEAETASRAKSDFLANISHEFQTPLNTVIGFTKVLADRLFGDLNAKQEEFVRYIAEAGERLSKLLNDIIEVSSVSSGHAQLKVTNVSIPTTLKQVITLLNPAIQEKGHVLTVEVALDADVPLEGDDEKIRQIFFHLLSNAVKFTPPGKKIRVETQRAVGKAGQEGVCVSIMDEGPGIRPEDIPKLFQNFGRLESAYTRQSDGIGVGLSLTRQLVELHGGDIQVESQYGGGATFRVFLPLKQKKQETLG
jgi:PAS domain S-box-containing protein